MPNGDPRDRFFYPTLTLMIDSYTPSLVLVQPRKTRLYITERLLMGRKESNQTNKEKLNLLGVMSKSLCDTFHYLLDNIFIRFGSKLYRQIVGFLLGTN